MATKKKLTKKDLETLRRSLEDERTGLVGQASELDVEADITQWRDAGLDGDPADGGSAAFERGRAQSLANHARRLVAQIDDALRRIEQGTYGACQRCGEPIEFARLETIPYAQYCLDCKRLEEHGR